MTTVASIPRALHPPPAQQNFFSIRSLFLFVFFIETNTLNNPSTHLHLARPALQLNLGCIRDCKLYDDLSLILGNICLYILTVNKQTQGKPMTTPAPHRTFKGLIPGRFSTDYYPLRWFDWIAAALLFCRPGHRRQPPYRNRMDRRALPGPNRHCTGSGRRAGFGPEPLFPPICVLFRLHLWAVHRPLAAWRSPAERSPLERPPGFTVPAPGHHHLPAHQQAYHP